MWTLISYNTSDKILGESGDSPVQPGGKISAVSFKEEHVAKTWLGMWLNLSKNEQRKIELYNNGELVESYYLPK